MREIMPMRRGLLLITIVAALFLSVVPVTAQSGGKTHTVHNGETLTSIANRYGISVDSIIYANELKNPNALYVGQVLKIPDASGNVQQSAPSAPAVPGTYVVKPGDTLIGIAGQYGISLDTLLAANKIKDPSIVQIGQVLKIPGSDAGFSAQPVSSVPAFPDGEQTLSVVGGPSINFKVEGGRLVSLTLLTTSSGKQGFPLSCEAKIAQQIAQMYGLNFDESGFMANLPHSLNPKRGFVGSANGRFYQPRDLIGGNANGSGGYGVHVEGWTPIFTALSGFQVRLLSSSTQEAGAQIDSALRNGYPVAVWAVLGFRQNIAKNSVWIGAAADGTAIDCGGFAPGCNYLVSGEHAYLIIGRTDNSYLVFDPGKGELTYFPRNQVIYGITVLFAVPSGSAPGAVIIPTADRLPDLSRLPNW